MKRTYLFFASLVSGMFFATILTSCQTAMLSATSDHPVPAANQPGVSYEEGTKEATVVVAGGCFWCTEAAFEQVNGVLNVVSGYAGGTEETANYQDVAHGRSTHAESIQITFDPSKIAYEKILQIFFTIHDPTQLNQQFPDVGKQYRSAVFYANEQEKASCAAYIKQIDASGTFAKPIATTLEPLKKFYPAEDYHQDYVKKNPTDRYVAYYAVPKIEKVRKLFPHVTTVGQQSDVVKAQHDRPPGGTDGVSGAPPKPVGSGTKPQGSGTN